MEDFDRGGAAGVPTICIVHSDPLLRAGLHALLGQSRAWRVADAPHCAHLLLADHDGAIDLALRRAPAAPVLAVTNLDREWDVRRALDAGVRGYVLQSCAVDELLLAVRQLLAGRTYLGEALRARAGAGSARIVLTRRETDVLRLLGEGNCNKLIARELGIGLGTVKTHVKSVMAKLGASARTQAVVLAAQRGLITPDRYAGAAAA